MNLYYNGYKAVIKASSEDAVRTVIGNFTDSQIIFESNGKILDSISRKEIVFDKEKDCFIYTESE